MDEQDPVLAGYLEALTCSPTIYSWHYDAEGKLLGTNCGNLLLSKIFEYTRCREYMLQYRKTQRAPLVLSAELGVMWCACFREEDIYVIGPVSNTEISLSRIQEAIASADLTYSVRERLKSTLHAVPTVSSVTFFQLGIMLHYYLTGEKIARSDLQFQHSEETAPIMASRSSRDRHKTWMVEQALLEHIRKGDIDYYATLERARLVSSGIRVKTEDGVKNAILSAYGFARLCTRAAIEGGLSPELAYTLGDSYSQRLLQCKTISDVGAVNNSMFEDFIRRVHAAQRGPGCSPQVRSCQDYIELHPEDELSLRLLAERIGYTESHLSRRFKAETGENIRDYIRYVRMERAKLLLETTDESIANIAQRLHYCSCSSFSDNFRRTVGKLPMEYRNALRKP